MHGAEWLNDEVSGGGGFVGQIDSKLPYGRYGGAATLGLSSTDADRASSSPLLIAGEGDDGIVGDLRDEMRQYYRPHVDGTMWKPVC
ncbi:hypothetical protein MTO96_028170 [Rhipicephalus appendiculatus]